MAVESRRGCGYRKIGGLYLVGGYSGKACDRIPIPLEVCPTCSQGIKQARGWTWIDIAGLTHGIHKGCKDDFPCPLCMETAGMGRAGLLWVGEKFYKTPARFTAEARAMGVSRRISTIPRGFEIGKTWVLMAHPLQIACTKCDGTGRLPNRETLDYEKCDGCDGKGGKPAIFYVFRPSAIEKILPESQRDSNEAEALQKRGITPVYVPDTDPDHKSSMDEDEEEE